MPCIPGKQLTGVIKATALYVDLLSANNHDIVTNSVDTCCQADIKLCGDLI